jgi:hypothetical protein
MAKTINDCLSASGISAAEITNLHTKAVEFAKDEGLDKSVKKHYHLAVEHYLDQADANLSSISDQINKKLGKK